MSKSNSKTRFILVGGARGFMTFTNTNLCYINQFCSKTFSLFDRIRFDVVTVVIEPHRRHYNNYNIIIVIIIVPWGFDKIRVHRKFHSQTHGGGSTEMQSTGERPLTRLPVVLDRWRDAWRFTGRPIRFSNSFYYLNVNFSTFYNA